MAYSVSLTAWLLHTDKAFYLFTLWLSFWVSDSVPLVVATLQSVEVKRAA